MKTYQSIASARSSLSRTSEVFDCFCLSQEASSELFALDAALAAAYKNAGIGAFKFSDLGFLGGIAGAWFGAVTLNPIAIVAGIARAVGAQYRYEKEAEEEKAKIELAHRSAGISESTVKARRDFFLTMAAYAMRVHGERYGFLQDSKNGIAIFKLYEGPDPNVYTGA